jgi:DNA mismatch repair protein MutS
VLLTDSNPEIDSSSLSMLGLAEKPDAQVLAALEARARGLDPLSDELPLFARPAATPAAAPPGGQHPALAALAALDPDALSPREAQEALYRLKSLLDGAVPEA